MRCFTYGWLLPLRCLRQTPMLHLLGVAQPVVGIVRQLLNVCSGCRRRTADVPNRGLVDNHSKGLGLPPRTCNFTWRAHLGGTREGAVQKVRVRTNLRPREHREEKMRVVATQMKRMGRDAKAPSRGTCARDERVVKQRRPRQPTLWPLVEQPAERASRLATGRHVAPRAT